MSPWRRSLQVRPYRCSPLSPKDSNGAADADAATGGPTQHAADGRFEHRRQLLSRRDAGPKGLDDLAPFARAAHRLPGHHPLRLAETAAVAIQVGVPRTDVMDNAGDRKVNVVIEALGRVGMNQAASVFPFGLADRVMRGEGFADRQERFPLVAHQMRCHVNMLAQHQARLALGDISHDPGPGVAGCRTVLGRRRRNIEANLLDTLVLVRKSLEALRVSSIMSVNFAKETMNPMTSVLSLCEAMDAPKLQGPDPNHCRQLRPIRANAGVTAKPQKTITS